MTGVNKVILVGNLGKDPEVRNLPNGDRVVGFSIATSETWTDKASGEKKDKTEWHNVSVFNQKLGEIAERYLKKGNTVYIEGQLTTRKFTDKDGVERQVTEVQISRFKGDLTLIGGRQQSSDAEGATNSASAPAAAKAAPKKQAADMDDEIPF